MPKLGVAETMVSPAPPERRSRDGKRQAKLDGFIMEIRKIEQGEQHQRAFRVAAEKRCTREQGALGLLVDGFRHPERQPKRRDVLFESVDWWKVFRAAIAKGDSKMLEVMMQDEDIISRMGLSPPTQEAAEAVAGLAKLGHKDAVRVIKDGMCALGLSFGALKALMKK
jgi:hypothetical protein